MLGFFYHNKGWLDWIFHENAWLTVILTWYYGFTLFHSHQYFYFSLAVHRDIRNCDILTTAASPFLNNEKADNFKDVTETSTNACKALLSYNFSEQF